jgi:hypothetical protein
MDKLIRLPEQKGELNGETTFLISSDRLQVELAWPGSAIQKGARFDLTGHAVQITLDGSHVFCAPESFTEDRGSGGLGLCNEFHDLDQTLFNSAPEGQPYPKMGVGIISKGSDNDYHFMNHYSKTPYPMEVSADTSSALFTVLPVECQGYAARLEKKVRVESNRLYFEYFFENAGKKAIEIMEYNHNFICIDRHSIGPDYQFTLPGPITMEKTPDLLMVHGNEVTWKATPTEPFYCNPSVAAGVSPHHWELVHKPSGVGVRETDSFPVHHLALWGTDHVVSPEVFVHSVLKPGESLRWSRGYEFFVNKVI